MIEHGEIAKDVLRFIFELYLGHLGESLVGKASPDSTLDS